MGICGGVVTTLYSTIRKVLSQEMTFEIKNKTSAIKNQIQGC